MSCVIAILLTSVTRMVVTSSGHLNYYGVYAIPKVNEFPVPQDHHQIHMSTSRVVGSGTYAVAYCSIKHQQRKIVEIITREHPEITHSPEETSLSNLEAEKECLKSISRKNFLESVAVRLSTLGDGKCTHTLIASLAFKGVIGIEGDFSCFAPPMQDQPIKVNADIPFDLYQFLSGGVLLRGENNKSDERALVWFQGNLHLLKRTRPGVNGYHSWSPISSIGSEINNGEVITNFIYDNLPNIQEFTRIMSDFMSLVKELNLSHSSDLLAEAKNNVDNLNHRSTVDYLDDVCLLEFGIKEERCGRLTNVPYYLKNEATSIGLLCENRITKFYPLTRNTECRFRPSILKKTKFISGQWKTAKRLENALEVPSQSSEGVNAEKFREFGGRGTMCETAA